MLNDLKSHTTTMVRLSSRIGDPTSLTPPQYFFGNHHVRATRVKLGLSDFLFKMATTYFTFHWYSPHHLGH